MDDPDFAAWPDWLEPHWPSPDRIVQSLAVPRLEAIAQILMDLRGAGGYVETRFATRFADGEATALDCAIMALFLLREPQMRAPECNLGGILLRVGATGDQVCVLARTLYLAMLGGVRTQMGDDDPDCALVEKEIRQAVSQFDRAIYGGDCMAAMSDLALEAERAQWGVQRLRLADYFYKSLAAANPIKPDPMDAATIAAVEAATTERYRAYRETYETIRTRRIQKIGE